MVLANNRLDDNEENWHASRTPHESYYSMDKEKIAPLNPNVSLPNGYQVANNTHWSYYTHANSTVNELVKIDNAWPEISV